MCLSLLGTGEGQKGEQWNEKTSTVLQVCYVYYRGGKVCLSLVRGKGRKESSGTRKIPLCCRYVYSLYFIICSHYALCSLQDMNKIVLLQCNLSKPDPSGTKMSGRFRQESGLERLK